MVNAIFNGLLKFFSQILDVVLYPINALLNNAFPDLLPKINTTLTNVLNYVGYIEWPLSILPPILRDALLFIIVCEITNKTVQWSYHLILKVPRILQHLKFW